MSSNKLVACAVLLLAAASAAAQTTTETPYTFDSLSAVQLVDAGVVLTGVQAGASLPSSVSTPLSSGLVYERCNKYFDLMIEYPSVYTLSFTVKSVQGPIGPILSLTACGLALKP